MSMSPAAALASLTRYFTSAPDQPRPAGWKVSLHTAAPGNAGTANEVSDGAYTRQTATFTLDTSDATGPVAANAASLMFPAAQGGYTATHVVVWDTTNSQPLAIQRLTTDKTISPGEQAQIAAGQLRIGGRN